MAPRSGSIRSLVSRLVPTTAACLLGALLAGGAHGAVLPGSSRSAVLVARSALLTLTATTTERNLTLHVTRNSDGKPIVGAGVLTATLDGHTVPVSAWPDGGYLIATRGLRGGTHALEVVVLHDGIHELLAGEVTLPESRSALELLQGHGMFAWWILNVGVVLIAVLALSRRRR